MHFAAFYIDSRHGSCGAIVLAGTAADTARLVYSGHRVAGGGVADHADGRGRTVAGTCAAADALRREAVLAHSDGASDADGGLLFFGHGLYGAGGTHLAAACAGRATIAVSVVHFRLHQGLEFGTRTQHLLRALADAQLAGGAAAAEVFQAEGAEGLDGRLAFGHSLLHVPGPLRP